MIRSKLIASVLTAALVSPALAQGDSKWGADDLRKVLSDHLVQIGRPVPDQAKIGPLDPRMNVPACEKLDISSRGGSGTSFILRCEGPQAWQHVLRVDNLAPGQAQSEVAPVATAGGLFRVVVAKVDLPAGSILTEKDLEERSVGNSPGATAVKTVSDAVGLRLTSSIGPGLALTTRHIARTPAILKGENVNLLANGSGFEITVPGRAEQDGYEGDVISVRNTRSGTVLKGRVGKGKIVSVIEM
jgi:flagella basal body P-ring formation protein FlgA